MRKQIKWTPELDQQLIELYKDHSTTQIAEIMGLTKSQIENHCRYLKLYKPKGWVRPDAWKDWENEIIIKNFNNMTYKELHELLPHRNPKTIQHQALSLGLKTEINFYTQEESEKLKEIWAISTKKEVQEKFPHRNWDSIVNHAHHVLGLKKESTRVGHYKVNENFFNPLTPESAYVLGFIYADGSIVETGTSFRINIADLDLLEDIKKVMCSEHPLKITREGNEREKTMYCLTVGSKKMTQDLLNLGLHRNKSKTIEFPYQIPKELYSHFIRGYFDGDGCISSGMASFVSSSRNFLISISQILFKEVDINITTIGLRKNGVSNYCMSNNEKLKKFFDYIYKDATIYLERKYKRFLLYKCPDILNQNTPIENVGCF